MCTCAVDITASEVGIATSFLPKSHQCILTFRIWSPRQLYQASQRAGLSSLHGTIGFVLNASGVRVIDCRLCGLKLKLNLIGE